MNKNSPEPNTRAEQGKPPLNNTSHDATTDQASPRKNYYAFIGGGSGQIGIYPFDPATGRLELGQTIALPGMNTSFMAFHPSRGLLFAVNESYNGSLLAFAIDPLSGNLRKLNELAINGQGPTHIGLDRSAQYVMTANYNTGQVSSYPIEASGQLGPLISQLNAGANAHQVLSAPTGTSVFAPCLGANTIALFDLNPKTGQLSAKSPAQLDLKGGGPRHMTFHPSGAWAYVLKELDSTIQALQFNSQTQALQLLGAPISTRIVQQGINSAAEIQIHPSGSYVYSSNRGDDTIAVFTVGSNGSLLLSSSINSGGATPRHFSIDPTGQWLLVAHQNSDSIKVFKIDRETGRLSPTDQSLAFGAAQFIQVLNVSDIRP